EGMARFLHGQLNGLTSRIFGQPTKPSYVYFREYLEGATLPWHVDRERSEFSISFLVDFRPEPAGMSQWPLYLDFPGAEPVAVHQAPGDGVFYQGARVPHFRKALSEGCRSTSLFFQYVPRDYEGPLW